MVKSFKEYITNKYPDITVSPSKKIEISLNPHVTVRVNPDYPLDENDLVKLNVSYNKAIRYLDVTLYELKYFLDKLSNEHGMISTETKDNMKPLMELMNKIFHIDFNQNVGQIRQHIHKVYSVLNSARDGLFAADKKLYLASGSVNILKGGVTGYIHPCVTETIYLDLSQRDDDYLHSLMRIIIHEATHLFGGAEDYESYQDYSDNLILKQVIKLDHYFFHRNEAPRNKCTNHAKSLENFVLALVETKNAHHHSINVDELLPDRKYIPDKTVKHQFPSKSIFQRIDSKIEKINKTYLLGAVAVEVATLAILRGMMR